MNGMELFNYGTDQLGRKNAIDAKILLEHCLKIKPSDYLLHNKIIKEHEKELYKKMLLIKKSGLPTAYITGETEFMGLKFYVDKNVLIPRQETEILVEEAIKLFTLHPSLLTILDIGTGSGNIAISLAKYLPNAKIVAIDVSEKALEVAKQNAKLNNVSNKITFLQSDIFSRLPSPVSRLLSFDLIISNPPYIRSSEIKKLQKEIQYEPRIALDGGKDGLKFYKKIISKSKKLLKKDGLIMFEIGYHHSSAIKKYMIENGFKNIEIKNDYSGEERVMYG